MFPGNPGNPRNFANNNADGDDVFAPAPDAAERPASSTASNARSAHFPHHPPDPSSSAWQQQQQGVPSFQQRSGAGPWPAHLESQSGARLIIARPPGADPTRDDPLHPALFVSEAGEGRSLMGVVQRTRDVNITLVVPYAAAPPSPAAPRGVVDELRCLVSYSPAVDACQLFCTSHHRQVLVAGEGAGQCYVLRPGQILTIGPGVWRVSVGAAGNDDVVSGAVVSVVEFIIIRRRFEAADVAGAAQGSGSMSLSTYRAVPDHTTPRGSITEFVMEVLRDRGDPSADNSFGVAHGSNETTTTTTTTMTTTTIMKTVPMEATTTSTTMAHLPIMQGAQQSGESSSSSSAGRGAQSFLARLRDGQAAQIRTMPPATALASSSPPLWTWRKAEAAGELEYSPGPSAGSQRGGASYLGQADQNETSSVFACLHSGLPNSTLSARALSNPPQNAASVAAVADLWQQEMRILAKLNHPNIVALRAYDARFFAIFLELLPNSLSAYHHNMPLNGGGGGGGVDTTTPNKNNDNDDTESEPHPRRDFSPSDAAIILRDTASALAHLDRQGISHNDIKPASIAYTRARGAVILDFGLATTDATAPPPDRRGGTAWYVAPEMADEPEGRGPRSDVWSLGVAMLFVLGFLEDEPEATGAYGPPWDFDPRLLREPDSLQRQAMEDWLEDVYHARDRLECDDDLVQRLVYDMLERDPAYRIEAKDIEEAIRATGTTLTGGQ